MSYFEEIDAWLSGVLVIAEDDDTEEQWLLRVKKQIKEKILESYRNGQKAGMKPSKSPAFEEKPEAKPRTYWQSRKAKRS